MLLKIKIEQWKIKRVLPYARNARLHSPEQVAAIAASIKEFGFVNPCLVDRDEVLIAGHGRIIAANALGMKDVPVIRLGHLTPMQVKALRLADNRIPLGASWSDELVKFELQELQGAGFDVSLTGFGELEIVNFTTNPDTGAPTQSLADRFGVVPFSVMNAREGWWQDRKRAWIALGIQSEVGRGENLLKFSDSVALDGDTYKGRQKKRASKVAAVG